MLEAKFSVKSYHIQTTNGVAYASTLAHSDEIYYSWFHRILGENVIISKH